MLMAANKLIQQSILPLQALLYTPRRVKPLKSLKVVSFMHLKSKSRRFDEYPSGFRSIFIRKVAETGSDLSGKGRDAETEVETEEMTVAQIKEKLYQEVEGTDRGLFGVPSAKNLEIERLVKLLEFQNPTQDVASNLDKVGGSWKLLYSTITILGAKRTKLGLRDFITLGDSFQDIDVAKGKAVNVIKFHARGLNLFNGQLTIEASFKISSKSRVDITYENSTITPDQLMNVYRKNYDILLGIFNPEGWLEISFVDETLRIGRDDKGNIFILERAEEI